MGLGAFVFALPHFLVGQYRATNSDQNVCPLKDVVAVAVAATTSSGMIPNGTTVAGLGSAVAAQMARGEVSLSFV